MRDIVPSSSNTTCEVIMTRTLKTRPAIGNRGFDEPYVVGDALFLTDSDVRPGRWEMARTRIPPTTRCSWGSSSATSPPRTPTPPPFGSRTATPSPSGSAIGTMRSVGTFDGACPPSRQEPRGEEISYHFSPKGLK